ncbi:MAG: hypothetical protein KC492_00705 [Myxococcales bacterium]|nr:hypothetical protein [Myxococcales bacterium]
MTESSSAESARDLLDKLRIPLVLVAIVLMTAAGKLEDIRPFTARAIVFGVPLLAVLYTSVGLLDTHPTLKNVGLALSGVSLLAAVWVGYGLFQVRAPLASGDLTDKAPRALSVPDARHDVELVVHGKILRADKGRLALTVSRAGHEQTLEHSFERHVVGKQGQVSVQHAWRERLNLEGEGPVQVAVSHADSDIKQPIGVELLPPPIYPKLPKAALIGLLALAVIVQAMVARRGLRAPVATGVAIALTFAAYAPELVDPERPYDGVFGLMIAALIAALVGLLAGFVVTKVLKPKAASQPAKGAA